MRVQKSRTLEEVMNLRSAAYLEAWPISNQLEATQDNLAGKPAKYQQMMSDFQSIRDRYPK